MRSLAAFLALLACSCAEFAGNGVSIGATWQDPDTGVTVDLRTAK